MVVVTFCEMPLPSTIPTDSTVMGVCVGCWRAQAVITDIRAPSFGPTDLPYDRASMPWVIMRPLLCWYCKSISGAHEYHSDYNLSMLYKKVLAKDYEQTLGSRLAIQCRTSDTNRTQYPDILMCDEMLNNTAHFFPELASDLLSQFTSGYIIRSIKTMSIGGPHEDFFYYGHSGDRSDSLHFLSWTKHTYAICLSCERTILFMGRGSITPVIWRPEGEDRTTDITIVCCAGCGHYSHSDINQESKDVGRLIRENHVTSRVITMSPHRPNFIMRDGEVNARRTSQLITDLQRLAATMLPHSVVWSVDTESGEVKMLEDNFLHFYR